MVRKTEGMVALIRSLEGQPTPPHGKIAESLGLWPHEIYYLIRRMTVAGLLRLEREKGRCRFVLEDGVATAWRSTRTTPGRAIPPGPGLKQTRASRARDARRAIMDLLRLLAIEGGPTPTIKEMARHLGVKPVSVYDRLYHMTLDGLLRLEKKTGWRRFVLSDGVATAWTSTNFSPEARKNISDARRANPEAIAQTWDRLRLIHEERRAKRQERGGSPLMVEVMKALREIAVHDAPMPSGPELGAIVGHGRKPVFNALKKLVSEERVHLEREPGRHRVVFPDGLATGWGKLKPGHAPYSRNPRPTGEA